MSQFKLLKCKATSTGEHKEDTPSPSTSYDKYLGVTNMISRITGV